MYLWPDDGQDDRSAGFLYQLAEESKGRYLLMTNLPGRVSRNNILHIFKGSKMLDCSLQEGTNTYAPSTLATEHVDRTVNCQ